MTIFGETISLRRTILDLQWMHPEVCWGIALLIIATGLALSSIRYGTILLKARFAYIMSVSASILIITNIVASLVYFVLPDYCDHSEPSMVITALNAHQGLPLYPDWSRGQGAYGMPYGPFFYTAVGLPLFASKSIVASKLVTSTAFLFALAAMWHQGRQSSTLSGRTIAKIYLVGLIPFGLYAFDARPDALLLALAAGGLMAIRIRKDTLRWLTLGVLTGLAVAIKIHAVLYFIPLGIFALVRASNAKTAALCVATGAVGFTTALVAAFEGNPQEAVDLGRYLMLASRHGLSMREIFVNLIVAVPLTALYGTALWQRRAWLRWDRRTVLTAVSMALTTAAVIIIAAKPGGGPRYLMPLLPVALFLTLSVQGPEVGEVSDPSPIFAAAMIAVALAVLPGTTVWFEQAIRGASDAMTAYSEAATLTGLYPSAQFGPTDDANYLTLRYRAGAALRGATLTFDVVAWMDFDFAGIRPADDAADFSPGPLVWILPRDGAPFSLASWYTGMPLFARAFQTDFRSRCQQIDVRKTFAAWRCEKGLLNTAKPA